LLAAAVASIAAASPAEAQQWARDMFSEVSHDFETVARGGKVEYRFALQNIYLEDAHISSARVSCGCTSPEIPTQVLKTWDKAEVVARVDTKGHLGQKDVTITVVFDRPFPAEVQLNIHCYIRSDVVLQPGAVQFGSLLQGHAAQQRVSVSYAGRNDWQILRVECANPSLSGQLTPISRGNGLVNYELLVNLAAGAPAGYLRDELSLVTNDLNPRAVRVPVPVEGLIQPGLSVYPSPLFMGTVQAGQSITRQMVLRGQSALRVVSVESTNPRFQCTPPTGSGMLQRLPVTFQAGPQPGKSVGRIRIQTDGSPEPLVAEVSAEVVPANPLEPPGPGKVQPAQASAPPAKPQPGKAAEPSPLPKGPARAKPLGGVEL
jgi:hypothetical protein